MAKKERTTIEVEGKEVSISSPNKPYFPELGITKMDLVQYYLAVKDGAVRGARDRPVILKRFVKGISEAAFFQKRAPKSRPEWLEIARLDYPSGRSADEVVITDAAALAWTVNLGCIDINPHPVRADDLEHPDELRIDLDPVPGVEWSQIREAALATKSVLDELGLVGWPKTSGSRGMHINVRLERRWTFPEVRRAAFAIARAVEKRAPEIATARWWKEERRGVFLDYNQNARDRTVASAYSVRPTPDARVSAPLLWSEVPDCEPGDFTLTTMPARFEALGDPGAGIDDAPCQLEAALELADRLDTEAPPEPPGKSKSSKKTGRRQPKKPLIEIGRAAAEDDARAGLERWKAKHPEVVEHLEPQDILVDSMRGRSSTWTRIRVNLEHVPETLRPAQAPLDPDYDPWAR